MKRRRTRTVGRAAPAVFHKKAATPQSDGVITGPGTGAHRRVMESSLGRTKGQVQGTMRRLCGHIVCERCVVAALHGNANTCRCCAARATTPSGAGKPDGVPPEAVGPVGARRVGHPRRTRWSLPVPVERDVAKIPEDFVGDLGKASSGPRAVHEPGLALGNEAAGVVFPPLRLSLPLAPWERLQMRSRTWSSSRWEGRPTAALKVPRAKTDCGSLCLRRGEASPLPGLLPEGEVVGDAGLPLSLIPPPMPEVSLISVCVCVPVNRRKRVLCGVDW